MALLRPADRIYTTPEDICTHLGEDYEDYYGAVNPPIYQTTLFGHTERGNNGYIYTRVANPTTEVAERKLAALEGADGALCFAAGMGAITAAIMHYVKPGCHIVLVTTSYPDAKRFITDYLRKKAGVTSTMTPGNNVEEIEAALKPETTLIYLESPSTTVLKMQDLEGIAKLAKSRGIGTVIDNTYATPLFQNPLKWGIDISIHTVSKYLCGHSNVVGGVVCAREEIINAIRDDERSLYGSILGPQESSLLINGLRTFPIRMKRHQENGMKLAEHLEKHPKVERVFMPGSATYAQPELFKKYMTGSTGLLSLIVRGDADDANRFIHSLKVFREGVSWGGFESLVSGKSVGRTPESCIPDDIVPNIIRMSVGLENIESLIADVDQALDQI